MSSATLAYIIRDDQDKTRAAGVKKIADASLENVVKW